MSHVNALTIFFVQKIGLAWYLASFSCLSYVDRLPLCVRTKFRINAGRLSKNLVKRPY